MVTSRLSRAAAPPVLRRPPRGGFLPLYFQSLASPFKALLAPGFFTLPGLSDRSWLPAWQSESDELEYTITRFVHCERQLKARCMVTQKQFSLTINSHPITMGIPRDPIKFQWQRRNSWPLTIHHWNVQS